MELQLYGTLTEHFKMMASIFLVWLLNFWPQEDGKNDVAGGVHTA